MIPKTLKEFLDWKNNCFVCGAAMELLINDRYFEIKIQNNIATLPGPTYVNLETNEIIYGGIYNGFIFKKRCFGDDLLNHRFTINSSLYDLISFYSESIGFDEYHVRIFPPGTVDFIRLDKPNQMRKIIPNLLFDFDKPYSIQYIKEKIKIFELMS